MNRLIDIRCSECDYSERDVWKGYQEYGDCAICAAPMERWHRHSSVQGDDIPGGLDIPHGLCWPDGTPRRFYSHSEIKREAQRLGWTNVVTHMPDRGSDKSRHTTRWF